MFNSIKRAAKTDSRLAGLLAEAREFAHVYALASQRQKGCDGMGELAAMKEEFRDVINRLVQYCREKDYISENMPCDIDSLADKLKSL